MTMTCSGRVAAFSTALVAACCSGLTGATAQTYAAQQAKLVAADSGVMYSAGPRVAVSGDTAVIGAPYDDPAAGEDSGSAYIFVLHGTSWAQQARLTASDAAAGDLFGSSVTVVGDTVVIGASGDDHAAGGSAGSAYVFVRSGSTWIEQAKLTASDGQPFAFFGGAIAMSGETALIGARLDDGGAGTYSGSAYVFVRRGTTWSEEAKLIASDGASGDYFGYAVALSGDTAVVGAAYDDVDGKSDSGSAYVFTRTGAIWSEQAKLTPPTVSTEDYFGLSVAVSGDDLVVGAPYDDSPGALDGGTAYIFTRSGTSWSQQAKLVASDASWWNHFGRSVALSGEMVLIGTPEGMPAITGLTGDAPGTAYVFSRHDTSWVQQAEMVAMDGKPFDLFGDSVALSEGTMLIGAPAAESAYVFALTSEPWSNVGTSLAGIWAPVLFGSGTLQAGSPGGLSVQVAASLAPCTLVVGLSPLFTPFKGGTLVPVPMLLVVQTTDWSGSALLSWTAWPSGFPAGTSLYFQAWITDPLGPMGYTATQGLKATTP